MKRVTAAILIENGQVLIARRPPSDPHAGKWEFPGGKIEEGETPEACLQRELREELGITVFVGDCFGTSRYTYDTGEIELLAYFAIWFQGELCPSFHDDFAWAAPEALLNYDLLPADLPLALQLIGDRPNEPSQPATEESSSACIFCQPENLRIVAELGSVFAVADKSPVTVGHALIIPIRHSPDYFSMNDEERRDAALLMDSLRQTLLESDPSITGFNIGINCGTDAGQTVMHTHIHLIPRREGDTLRPEGGVRGVIPDKMHYE